MGWISWIIFVLLMIATCSDVVWFGNALPESHRYSGGWIFGLLWLPLLILFFAHGALVSRARRSWLLALSSLMILGVSTFVGPGSAIAFLGGSLLALFGETFLQKEERQMSGWGFGAIALIFVGVLLLLVTSGAMVVWQNAGVIGFVNRFGLLAILLGQGAVGFFALNPVIDDPIIPPPELKPSAEDLATPYVWTLENFYSHGRDTKCLVTKQGVWFYREFWMPSYEEEPTWGWDYEPLDKAINSPTWYRIYWTCEPKGTQEAIIDVIQQKIENRIKGKKRKR